MDGWMDGWMAGCMHACMHGYMDACMHAWMHVWMHGFEVRTPRGPAAGGDQEDPERLPRLHRPERQRASALPAAFRGGVRSIQEGTGSDRVVSVP